MRIYFAGYPLCGDPAANPRDNPQAQLLSKQAVREQQLVAGAGYEEKEFHDRGNLGTTISFQANKRFLDGSGNGDPQAAELYMLAYEAAGHHPWKGTLKIVSDASSEGVNDKQVEMHDALISPPSFNIAGCLVTATYTVQGGKFGAAVDVTNWLFAVTASGKILFTGDTTPDAAQMFKIDGTKVVYDTAFTTDPHFAFSSTKIQFTGS